MNLSVTDVCVETGTELLPAVLLKATPLFQINFLPDLIQVKVLLAAIEVLPTFLHVPPDLVAAEDSGMMPTVITITEIRNNLILTA